jgi:release factor glutamine methyltransferase
VISEALHAKLLGELKGKLVPLADKPDETPAFTLHALIEKSGGDEAVVGELVRRRIDGVPLSHLTGRQIFMGIEMLAGPEALIPRKETEIVCRGALSRLPTQGACRVIDVCCGAGNLGLAIAMLRPEAVVTGSDLSVEAVALANRNVAFLGVSDRVSFQAGDLFAPFDTTEYTGQIDLIICNPPYISSARVDQMPREIAAFEPRLAFDGGPFGVRILTRLVREARKFLKPDSWLAFEVGLGQGPAMQKILQGSPLYQDVESLPDEGGETRALLARAAVDRV